MACDIANTDPKNLDCVGVISLDVHNAFNAITRKSLYNTIAGDEVRFGTSLFRKAHAFLSLFYGVKGSLRYTAPNGTVHNILSEKGVHQGDIWSPALFAAAVHPVVCSLMEECLDVSALLYADNIFLVGPIRLAASAAAKLRSRLQILGLSLNADESVAYIPKWGGVSVEETAWGELKDITTNFPLQYSPQGLNVLGIPFGVDNFVHIQLDRKVQSIIRDLPRYDALTDGLMHYQMYRFCVNQQFLHWVRALPFEIVKRHAKALDDKIMCALTEYWGFEQMPDASDAQLYKGAKAVVRRPIPAGGFGITSLFDVSRPAFYHGFASSLRYVCDSPALCEWLGWSEDFLQNVHPLSLTNDFISQFYNTSEWLLQNGCRFAKETDEIPQGDVAVLPTWKQLMAMPVGGGRRNLPPQRIIVRSVMLRIHTDAEDGLSTDQVTLIQQRRVMQTTADSELKHWMGVPNPKSFKLSYNPLGFMLAVAPEAPSFFRFPKHLFTAWVRWSLGLPLYPAQDGMANITCSACGKQQGRFGDHDLTCSVAGGHDGVWKKAHDHVLHAVHWCFREARPELKPTITDGNITRHLTSGKHADIQFNEKIGRFMGLVADFTMTHVRYGSGVKEGEWKEGATRLAKKLKENKHGPPYAKDRNMMFVPLIANTCGAVSDDMVRLMWIAAHYASRVRRVAGGNMFVKEDEKSFQKFRSARFAKMKYILSAAVAKVVALRLRHDVSITYFNQKSQVEYYEDTGWEEELGQAVQQESVPGSWLLHKD